MAVNKKSMILLMAAGCITATVYPQSGTTDVSRTVVSVVSTKKFNEFAPTISADGRTLIFETNRDKDWKLYESHLEKSGRWTEPFPITAVNEKLNFLAGPSLSYDGNILYFTGFIENVTTSEDIFYSERLDDHTWSPPKSIGAPINTDGYDGFPSISADGNSLYFIRVNEENFYDKRSKENCFMIYVSHKQSDGSWGAPELLPPSINSGCVRDPRIMADNKTLIFSAVMPGGKGKYDLYLARKTGPNTWTTPVPLDFVNSEENDQSICISASGDVMFFYSNEDIYSIPVPLEYRQMVNVVVQGQVLTEKTNQPVKANIVVKSLTSGESFMTTSQSGDGKYSIVLSAGHRYAIEFSSPLAVAATYEFDFSKESHYVEVTKDVYLADTYQVKIAVLDKDLKKPVTAWFYGTQGDGRVIASDSVRKDISVVLHAGMNYKFIITAPGYAPESIDWKFAPTVFKQEMEYQVMLEHIKVPFVADVVNVVTAQKLKTKVYFRNEDEDEVIVAEAGETVYLRESDRYQVVTSSDKGYIFSTASVSANASAEPDVPQTNHVTLKVTPVGEGAHVTLDHIGFNVNSYELLPVSFLTLDRVVELMQKNPDISIQISAHTDDVGEEAYNQRLSEHRALSVVRYLHKHGIGSERMRPKGYGEKSPLVPNDSESNRAINRRVELDILRMN